jgi:methyl-accepting chemotaxis protein
MQHLSENVQKAMQTLAQINQQSSSSIELITASTDEMNEEVADINKMAHILADMSQSQQDLLSQFTLEDTD